MSEPARVVRVASAPGTGTARVPAPAKDPVTIPLRIRLGQLADVDDRDAPADAPLLWRRDPDTGVYRLEPPPPSVVPWGDEIRVRDHPPTDPAPPGSIHWDAAAGRIYRYGEAPTP